MKTCRIGCSIVNENGDSAAKYDLKRDLETLPFLHDSGISDLEFFNLLNLSVQDARDLKNRCDALNMSVWSVHSECFRYANQKDRLK